jgi:hypothetical protein
MLRVEKDYNEIEKEIENCFNHNFYYSLTVYNLLVDKIQTLPEEKRNGYMVRLEKKRKDLEGKTLLLHAIRF